MKLFRILALLLLSSAALGQSVSSGTVKPGNCATAINWISRYSTPGCTPVVPFLNSLHFSDTIPQSTKRGSLMFTTGINPRWSQLVIPPNSSGMVLHGGLEPRWGQITNLDLATFLGSANAFGGPNTFSGPVTLNSNLTGSLTTQPFTGNNFITTDVLNFNAINFTTEYQKGQGAVGGAEALTIGMTIPASTNIHQTNVLGVYEFDSSTSVNAVGAYFSARATAAGTHLWPFNTIFIDDGNAVDTGTSAEFDSNVSNANTVGSGIQIAGVSSLNLVSFPAIHISALSGGGKWSAEFADDAGGANTAFDIQAQNTGASATGKTINFHAKDASAVDHFTYMQASVNGGLDINPPSGQGIGINHGNSSPRSVFEVDTGGDFNPDALASAVTHGTAVTDSGNVGIVSGISATGTIRGWIQSRTMASGASEALTLNELGGSVGVGKSPSGAVLDVGASTSALASLNITPGVAVTTPTAGNIWIDTNEEKHVVQTGTAGAVNLYDSGGTNAVTVTPNGSVTAYTLSIPAAAPSQNHVGMDCTTAGACVFSANSQTVGLTSAYTNATTGATNVTGLSFSVDASKTYQGYCELIHQVSANTAGLRITFTAPASPTAIMFEARTFTTATTDRADVGTTAGTLTTGAATTLITTNLPARIGFRLRNGVNAGTLQLQAASFGTGTLTIQPDSFCVMQ